MEWRGHEGPTKPGARSRAEKFWSSIADRAADRAGRALYKRKVVFLDDPSWRAPYERLLEADRRPGKPSTRALDRRFTVVQAAKSVQNLEGSSAECGAYRGVGSGLICETLKDSVREGDRHFVFDSFEGLPEPSAQDEAGNGQWWSAGDLNVEQSILDRLLEPYPFAEILAGWIPDRFAEVGDRRFRFVHVDVDLYDPTKSSIDFFFPRLVPGGVLLLDDHGVLSCPGARQAAEDYFAGRPESIIELPNGQALVIRGSD